jgi:hypothetical protein
VEAAAGAENLVEEGPRKETSMVGQTPLLSQQLRKRWTLMIEPLGRRMDACLAVEGEEAEGTKSSCYFLRLMWTSPVQFETFCWWWYWTESVHWRKRKRWDWWSHYHFQSCCWSRRCSSLFSSEVGPLVSSFFQAQLCATREAVVKATLQATRKEMSQMRRTRRS